MKDSRCRDGVTWMCRGCFNGRQVEYRRKWRDAHPVKRVTYGKESCPRVCGDCGVEKPADGFYRAATGYYLPYCKECSVKRSAVWRKKNTDRCRELGREGYIRNRDVVNERSRQYAINHRDELMRKRLERYHSDPMFNLQTRFITRISQTIREKKPAKHKWFDILGYNKKALMRHLERRFQEGMSWDNYGEWHIDHIIPVSAFNFTSVNDLDFKRCWSLKNLRPLWRSENISKGAKIDAPFQPSLAIAI